MFITNQLQRLLIGFAVLTSFGVLVHDTKFDQATALALALPFGATLAAADAVKLKGDAHTHVERAAFANSAHTLSGVPPKRGHRKYVLSKHVRAFNTPEQHTLVLDDAVLA